MKFFTQFLDESAKQYDNFFVLQLCNSLKYEKFAKGQIIFEQHQPSNNKLYVILSGKVMIQKKEELDKIMAIREQRSCQEISPTNSKIFSPPTTATKTTKPMRDLFTIEKFPEISVNKPQEIYINKPYEISLNNPLEIGKSIDISVSKSTDISLINKPIESLFLNHIFPSGSLERIASEESIDVDLEGDIYIDQMHYELNEKIFGDKIKKESNLSTSNFNSRRTVSHNSLEFGNFHSIISSTADFNKKPKSFVYEDNNIFMKWSMLLSKHFYRILKKPLKLLKSQIISPNLLENLLKNYGNIIRIMEKGDAVGEKALIENNPRSATVCAITPCEFIILEKKDLKDTKEQFEGVLNRRTDFLIETLKLNHQSFSSKVKENMLYSFSVEKYAKGSNITNQGQHDMRFYLIEEGEVMIEKLITIKENIKGHKEFLKNRIEKVDLCVSGRGNFLGEEILFSEENLYEYTSMVISKEVTVLVVNKHIFSTKFPSEIRQLLATKYQLKTNNRKKHIANFLRKNHQENTLNTASDIFYSRGVNVFNLLQESCYGSFNKNIKRGGAANTEPSEEKPTIKRSDSQKSSHLDIDNEREKFAKYYIGPRSKCKYIENTISFPKSNKIFNLNNIDNPLPQKSFSKPKNILRLSPLKGGSINPYDSLAHERKVIRKGEANQPMIDLEMLLNYSEGFMKKNQEEGKLVLKLDFGEEDEVRFKCLRSKELDYNYLGDKDYIRGSNLKKLSCDESSVNKNNDGEGVFVNYSKNVNKKILEKEKRQNGIKIDLEDLSHMNSTYNFSTMKKNGSICNSVMNKDKEASSNLKRELLEQTLKCCKIENKKGELIINENLGGRVHEKIGDELDGGKRMHKLRLVKKCREKKQIGRRGFLI